MYRHLAIVLILGSFGCANVYVPVTSNVPFFTEKGTLNLSGRLGNSYEVQAAYSAGRHLGIMANGSMGRRGAINDTSNYHRHHYGELAVGYYHHQSALYTDVWCGWGRGTAHSGGYGFLSSERIYAEGSYQRMFIQPSIGLHRQLGSIAFVPRIAYVDFYALTGNAVSTKEYKPSFGFFFEPSLNFRLNVSPTNKINVLGAAGLSAPFKKDRIYFDHRFGYFSLGLGLRWN